MENQKILGLRIRINHSGLTGAAPAQFVPQITEF
jgi:hypothetical protein